MNGILWQPYFPIVPTLLCAACLLFAVLTAFVRSSSRRWGQGLFLLLLRLGVLTALLILLMGPSKLPTGKRPSKEEQPVALLLDSSGSMLTPDMSKQSRWEFVLQKWLSPDMIRQYSGQGSVIIRTFDLGLESADAASLLTLGTNRVFGSETRLVSALNDLLDAPQELKHIVILSDGRDSQNQDASGAIAHANDRGVRIHTVPVGGPRLERDLHIAGVLQQPYLIAGEEGLLRVRILQANVQNQETTLHVTHRGQTRSYPVKLTEEPVVNIDLPLLHQEAGSFSYTLQVDPLPGEIEQRNNHQTLFVDVTPERFRVLMLEGQPFWDSKFIAQSLRLDSRLELMQVSQIAAGRREVLLTRMEADEAVFPETLDDLAAFDVVILGRQVEKIAGEDWLALLPAYVKERGGRIIFARGRAVEPDAVSDHDLWRQLKMLEPVELENDWRSELQFLPTAMGKSHPVLQVAPVPGASVSMFESMRPVPHVRVSRAVPGSQVLAEYQTEQESLPGLVAMPQGAGSTMMMLGEGIWRWRMPKSGQQELKGVYETLWSNAVRWMLSAGEFMPGSDIAMRVYPRHLKVGEEVNILVTTRVVDTERFPQGVTLTYPDGKKELLGFYADDHKDRRAEIRWTPKDTGVYRIGLQSPGLEPDRQESLVNVYDANVERLQSGARPAVLKMIAEETGGLFMDPYQPESFRELLAKSRTLQDTTEQPEPVWNTGNILILLLSTAGLEWMLRRRWGWS